MKRSHVLPINLGWGQLPGSPNFGQQREQIPSLQSRNKSIPRLKVECRDSGEQNEAASRRGGGLYLYACPCLLRDRNFNY